MHINCYNNNLMKLKQKKFVLLKNEHFVEFTNNYYESIIYNNVIYIQYNI